MPYTLHNSKSQVLSVPHKTTLLRIFCILFSFLDFLASKGKKASHSLSRNMSDAGASDSSCVEWLKNALTKHGTVLFLSCDSTKALLKKLDRLENLLSKVFQGYKELMENQLLQSKESLIANELIRHPELDVRVSVASCISQIIRITAPDEPFEEDHLEEFFRLAISAFEKLSYMSGRVYNKAVSILYTMSYSQSCLAMLDLKMDPTISLMFNLFLGGIRTSHPKEVFSNMEKIMTLIICNAKDTDEFLFELVKIILNSLRRENQNVSPASFQLAENTFKNCSGFLKAFLSEVGRCLDVPIEDYAEVVVSFFQDGIQRENTDLKGTVGDISCLGESGLAIDDLCNLTEGNETQNPENSENCYDNRVTISHFSDDTDKIGKSADMPQEEIPEEIHSQRKRQRRPNSLKRAEEGYDPFWMLVDWKSMENSPSENSKKNTNGSAKTTISKLSSKSAGNPKPSNKNKVSDRNEDISGIEALNLNNEGKTIVSEDQCRDLTVKNPSEKERRSSTNLASVKKSRGKTTVSEDLNEDVVNHSEKGRGSSTEVASVKRSRGKTFVSEDLKEDIMNQSEKGRGSSTDVAIVDKSRGKTILYEDRKENTASWQIPAPQCRRTSSKAKALSRKVSKRPKRKSAIGPFRGEVIGCRIKVWWQLDRRFYKGTITNYDPETNYHVVEYDDGDMEQLVLEEEECWEMLPGHKLSAHDQEVDADSTFSKSKKE